MVHSSYRIAGLLILFIIAAAPAGAAEESGWLKTLSNSVGAAKPEDQKPVAVVGTRGLNETSESIDTAARADAAIERLEKIAVSPQALDAFIAAGNLQ